MPTVETLFGPEEVAEPKPRQIKFKQIKAVFETLTVQEEVSGYLQPLTRYTSASEVFNTFCFLRQETKEYFMSLHLDGKNRVVCIDVISTGLSPAT